MWPIVGSIGLQKVVDDRLFFNKINKEADSRTDSPSERAGLILSGYKEK